MSVFLNKILNGLDRMRHRNKTLTPHPPPLINHNTSPPPIKINLLKVAELLPRDLFSTALPAPPKEKSLNTFHQIPPPQ